MTIRSALAMIFGLTLVSGASMAAGKSFSEMDTDADGVLSRAEATMADVDFTAADADGNGKVSRSEYQAVASAGSGGQSDQGESIY